MRRKAREVRFGLLLKLTLFFLILTIPVNLISLSILNSAVKSMHEEATQSTYSKLQFFLDRLEADMEKVKQFEIVLRNDQNIQFLSSAEQMEGYEKVRLYKDLLSKFGMIVANSEYIDDLFVNFYGLGERLSHASGYSKIPVSETELLFDSAKDNSVLQRFYRKVRIANQLTDVLTFALYAPGIFEVPREEVSYVLGMDISLDKFGKLLRSFKVGDSGEAFILDPDKNGYVGSRSRGELEDRIVTVLEQQYADSSQGSLTLDESGESYMVVYQKSKALNWTLAVYVVESDITGSIDRVRHLIRILIIVSIFSIIGISMVTYREIYKPIRLLFNAMRNVERGNHDTRIVSKRKDEFQYVYHQFNQMVIRIEQLIQEVYVQELRLNQAELKQLQSQINPHFLYNCFYIIYRMSQEGNNEIVSEMAEYLGKYFRFITHSAAEEVRLQEELQHSGFYMKIQKIRFPERLDFQFSADPGLMDVYIPRLIVQPLVENAIVHGMEKTNKKIIVSVDVSVNDSFTEIMVNDNGPGVTEEQRMTLESVLADERTHPKSSCALWNIHWRLRYKYGPGYGVDIPAVSLGFKVVLRLPNSRKGDGSDAPDNDRG
ncbi:sensor histidine kinase [Paenibacillus sp. J5C_2022]|uniref:sensor histidine kinase n=1 Tax=Paenibacillus sp. J5C2022 TaxID=2977129 RepID=UPI0021D0AC58|nr:sensor histidine kinase [Paenibacillus sp. J5C2022]MCU6712276.1 sensor histidine kinase [Paenibacillus sp. J5C2022]